MLTNNLTPILTDLGLSMNKWEYCGALKNIYLTTDINQQLFVDVDMIFFDSGNELVKIKKFDSQVVSGRFGGQVISPNEVLLTIIYRGPSIVEQHRMNFRKPKVGDNLYIMIPSGELLENDGDFVSAKITEIVPDGINARIKVDANLFTGSSVVCVYTDLDINNIPLGIYDENGGIDGAVVNEYGVIGEHYRFLNVEGTLCRMSPISRSPYDSVFIWAKVSGLGIEQAAEVY